MYSDLLGIPSKFGQLLEGYDAFDPNGNTDHLDQTTRDHTLTERERAYTFCSALQFMLLL